ncbi:MAG: hypothetical protein ACKV0T_05120, partial [Planctomycetales bacterium]
VPMSEPSITDPPSRPVRGAGSRSWLKRAAIALGIVAVVFGGFLGIGRFVWFPWKYPYGWSHSCDKVLHLSLINYADAHGGWFPSGEATPEASLSLLARPPYNTDAEILRGKIVPKEVVEGILSRGELLGPETCGWHYVEGLRNDDDPRLAVFWDKVGLGHNGERLPDGGHVVTRIGRPHDHIPASAWPQFLDEQQRLLADLDEWRAKKRKENQEQENPE